MRNALIACALVLMLLVTATAHAQRRAGGGGGPARGDFGQSLPAPGLSVSFFGGATCTEIASPYGSPTRYDGSLRSTGGAEGLHGGIDLSLAEGTPLLAIAAGVVLGEGVGGQLEGIFLWLLHLPEHTGLPFGYVSKYQHLSELPGLARGAKVALGQKIAKSGRTGTVGGHYGGAGYPHLHLTVRAISPEKLGSATALGQDFPVVRDATLIDPLTVYVFGLTAPENAAALPADKKKLTVAYVNAGGSVQPDGAKAVWPVACP